MTINVEDNESGVFGYKRCMGQTECEPDDTIYTNESILISTESASNYVCVIGVDNRGNESDKNCEVYKLDKTLPTIEGVGDITVNINEQVDLTNEVTYNDGLSGIDGELSINPTTVDTTTVGTKQVTYKVQDIAGNVREVVRNIIVDADAPTIVFNLVDSSTINSNGWAKSDFYIRATITDNSGSGIASGSSCTTNSSSECDPIASFTGTTKDFLISTEGSNRACIEVTDNNNKTTKVCSNTYNLDKTAPTAGTATFSGTLGSNSWYTTNVTVNKVNGSDALSGHSSTTSNISSITSNTTGTMITITTTDLAGNSSTRNYTIKVDKNAPTLTAKSGTITISKGDSNAVSNYFTVSYGISGGTISCSPSNTSGLSNGTQTVRCTATGGNGKTITASKQIIVGTPPNAPELLNNMIPVKYNGSNWVYADVSQEWYNYDKKEWANAVVLNSGVTKSVGQTISESEIALWYVWIPRYKYTIFNGNNGNVSEQLINIEFESGTARTGTVTCQDNIISGISTSSETCSQITNNVSTYTHPAFNFGGKQLKGFWVGKFEVSGTTSKVTTKPGITSLRNVNVYTLFNSIQGIKTSYGINNGDSHMIKNMEWGAVAYLSHSIYGLGMEDIKPNTSSTYLTGGGSNNAYKNNVSQSTTGNIYGVYDMAGGAYDYTMGNSVDSSGNFYASSSGFSSAPDSKYYDKYAFHSSSTNHTRGKLGDATKETMTNIGNISGGWHGDGAAFPSVSLSWFIRGSSYEGIQDDGIADAGIFAFGRRYGSVTGDDMSTHAVLTSLN